VLLAGSIAIVSCKGKSAKDYIVNKWKITDISGKGVEGMPDSAKTKIYETAAMDFKKDGKYESADMGGGPKKGVYTISSDGKSLMTTDEGSTVTDTLELVEVTADKMIVNDKKGEVKITFGHK
jgi:hypothetical protein